MSEKTGNRVIGNDREMVDEIKISGVKHVSVVATVPEDATYREKARALKWADGAAQGVDIKGEDY
jgi:hypothetical protein